MTPISDDMVERAARASCIVAGDDPDQVTYAREMACTGSERTQKFRWQFWEPFARAALTAALEGSVAVPAWQTIETAPSACHVVATRFDECEWIYAIVSSPPTKPFTHWQPLPAPPLPRQERCPDCPARQANGGCSDCEAP